MGDAVAALDAAEMAGANDGAGAAEIGRHRRPRRVVDEMNVAAELAFGDLLADRGGELEQPGVGCQHEIIAAADLEEPRLALGQRLLALDESGMAEKAAQAALDQADRRAHHRAA